MKFIKSINVLICSATTTLSACTSVQAKIISVSNMKDAKQSIENCNEKNLLIAFDVDMTITQPDHPALFYSSLIKYKESYQAIVGNLTPEQKDIMLTLTIFQPQRLVEENTPEVIKNLQQVYKVIAFTNSLSKQDVIERRINVLDGFGIKFSQNISGIKDVTLNDIKVYNNCHPLFTKGILFGNGDAQGKGIVLCAFLKRLKKMPKVVVVIDDRKKI